MLFRCVRLAVHGVTSCPVNAGQWRHRKRAPTEPFVCNECALIHIEFLEFAFTCCRDNRHSAPRIIKTRHRRRNSGYASLCTAGLGRTEAAIIPRRRVASVPVREQAIPRIRTAGRPRGGDTHQRMNTEGGDLREAMGYEANKNTALHGNMQRCSNPP